MDLCTPAQPKAVLREDVLDQNQPLVDMELATPAPSSKLYLPKVVQPLTEVNIQLKSSHILGFIYIFFVFSGAI